MSYKPRDTKEIILHRFKIAHGHLQKVIRMMEEGEYCIDILHQSQAVQRALQETNGIVLENHLKTCVVSHIKKGQVSTSIKEIMNVFHKIRQ